MRIVTAALLPLLLTLAAPAATSTDLDVYRADLRFGAGGKVKLRMETNLDALLADRPETLRVTVGTTVVLDAALLSARAKARTNDWGRYSVRDPSHLGERCRLNLKYERISGHMDLRITGLEAAPFQAAGPAAVPVSLEISGRTVRATVAFTVVSPRRWAWWMPGHEYGGHPIEHQDPPGPPQPPPPSPPPATAGWRGLASGWGSAILTEVKTELRTAGQFQAFWSQNAPGTPAPAVDFSREFVIAYVGGSAFPSNNADIELQFRNGVIEARPYAALTIHGAPRISAYRLYAVTPAGIPVVWKKWGTP